MNVPGGYSAFSEARLCDLVTKTIAAAWALADAKRAKGVLPLKLHATSAPAGDCPNAPASVRREYQARAAAEGPCQLASASHYGHGGCVDFDPSRRKRLSAYLYAGGFSRMPWARPARAQLPVARLRATVRRPPNRRSGQRACGHADMPVPARASRLGRPPDSNSPAPGRRAQHGPDGPGAALLGGISARGQRTNWVDCR
jgi:hypothetical protein